MILSFLLVSLVVVMQGPFLDGRGSVQASQGSEAGNQAITLLQRGLAALQHGQLTEARSALEQAAKLEPQNAFVWASLAETYARLKEPEKASAAAATAEKTGGGNPVLCQALAIYYLRREDFGGAARVATEGLQTRPDDAQLTLTLGVARYGQRRFDEAVVTFLKVIRLDPQIEQPYRFLGKVLDQAGSHLGEITKDCEAWASNNPTNAEAQLVLAKARLAADPKATNVEGLLRRSIALDATDWEPHFELGALLESKRDYRGAAEELERAVQFDAKQPMPHYHLARVYDRLGQADKATAEREIHQRLTGAASQK